MKNYLNYRVQQWHIFRCIFYVFAFCVAIQTSHASMMLDRNRVVFPAGYDEVTVKVTNSSERDFLIQSWILDERNNAQQKIFVEPPIAQIKASHKVSLKINVIDPSLQNGDREQLFWLNVKEIPRIEKNDSSKLSIATLTKIKVFYRPSAIAPDMNDSYKELRWVRQGNNLVIKNPTPYHITFSRVWLGSDTAHPINIDMVKPYGELKVANASKVNTVHYQIIRDYGDNSEIVTKTIN